MEEHKVKKPPYRQWWFWAIIIVVAVVIIAVAVSSGGGEENPTGFYINDTVTSSSVEFKVTSVENATHIGSEYLGADTEYNFIIITLTVKNTGSEEASLLSSYFTLKKGGSSYDTHSSSIYLDNGLYIIENIGSGLTKTIVVVFETPTASDVDTYSLNVKSGSFATVKEIVLTAKPE